MKIKISKKSLKCFSTEELVNELIKREGVKEIIAEPQQEYEIKVGLEKYPFTGPAIILQIID